MSIARLVNRPCTIVRRSETDATDAHGNPQKEEAEVETVCELQRQAKRSSDEPAGAGELSDTLWDLYLLPGTDIRTEDAIVVDGAEYEMVGDPWAVRSPFTKRESHIEATVRRTAIRENSS
jgi:hypothetical protein